MADGAEAVDLGVTRTAISYNPHTDQAISHVIFSDVAEWVIPRVSIHSQPWTISGHYGDGMDYHHCGCCLASWCRNHLWACSTCNDMISLSCVDRATMHLVLQDARTQPRDFGSEPQRGGYFWYDTTWWSPTLFRHPAVVPQVQCECVYWGGSWWTPLWESARAAFSGYQPRNWLDRWECLTEDEATQRFGADWRVKCTFFVREKRWYWFLVNPGYQPQ